MRKSGWSEFKYFVTFVTDFCSKVHFKRKKIKTAVPKGLNTKHDLHNVLNFFLGQMLSE